MPSLGVAMTEGVVLRWCKQPGDRVLEGETLLEIETDKTAVEIGSPATGIVGALLVAEGATVPTGEVLTHVEEGTRRWRTATAPRAAPRAAPGAATAAVPRSARVRRHRQRRARPAREPRIVPVLAVPLPPAYGAQTRPSRAGAPGAAHRHHRPGPGACATGCA